MQAYIPLHVYSCTDDEYHLMPLVSVNARIIGELTRQVKYIMSYSFKMGEKSVILEIY